MKHTQSIMAPAWGDGRDRSLAVKIALVLAGTVALTLSSHIEVPMVPVPMTMQTLAVVLLGALYGPRLAGATVVAWLAQGAVGLPVFAGGAGGVHHLFGPTGGYLLSFPLAAMLTGWITSKAVIPHAFLSAGVAALAGHALCLLGGAAWLSVFIGAEAAIMGGVVPFILGAVLKSALAAGGVVTVRRRRPKAG